jgi:hypothetical protein
VIDRGRRKHMTRLFVDSEGSGVRDSDCALGEKIEGSRPFKFSRTSANVPISIVSGEGVLSP